MSEKSTDVIYLKARSKESEPDWYGDYSFYENPLERYYDSKRCKVTRKSGGMHSTGWEYILVETTKRFLKYMGWESDLKYQVTEKEYEDTLD